MEDKTSHSEPDGIVGSSVNGLGAADRHTDPGQTVSGLRYHVEMIHKLAETYSGQGVLVLASYGQDPITGNKLRPRVDHFEIGDVDRMVKTAEALALESHRNLYVPLAVFRTDLMPGRKGGEADIVAVLGLVADFDDPEACKWAERSPVPPNYVLETSEGRYQAFFLFDSPAPVLEAKRLAKALTMATNCDRATSDMSHVWRIAGTLNHPNKIKVDRGRSTNPQAVLVEREWDGGVIQIAALSAALEGRTSGSKEALEQEGLSSAIKRLKGGVSKLEDVEVALRIIPSDDRPEWIRVALALKYEFGDAAFDTFDNWSRKSSKYEGVDSTRQTWDGLIPNGGVTCHTIFWMARKYAVQRAEAAGKLVLSHKSPWASAETFIAKHYLHEGQPILRSWQETFYEFTGTRYEEVKSDKLRVLAYKFLNGAFQLTSKGKVIPFDPTDRLVNAFVDALKAVVHLDAKIQAPSWLGGDGKFPAAEILTCKNGLLHMPTRTLSPHTPLLFSLNSLDIDYDAMAVAPRFDKFLEELFPDDPESARTLLEEIGYFLTPSTSLQKIFLWVGAPRSGKGTLARIVTQLLGPANICAPNLKLLNDVNGSSVMIGKTLAILSDIRQSRNMGSGQWQEKLLAISGEDWQSLGRKYKSPWEGILPTRLLLSSNRIPTLIDASGALAARFIVIVFRVSFLGREDPDLTSKLLAELPGILNRALDGHDRLKARGRFVQPASSAETIDDIAELGSPIKAFISECCVLGEGQSVPRETLYEAYRAWCSRRGRDHPVARETFGADLHAALPNLGSARPRGDDGTRPRAYVGIGLKPPPMDTELHRQFKRAGLSGIDLTQAGQSSTSSADATTATRRRRASASLSIAAAAPTPTIQAALMPNSSVQERAMPGPLAADLDE